MDRADEAAQYWLLYGTDEQLQAYLDSKWAKEHRARLISIVPSEKKAPLWRAVIHSQVPPGDTDGHQDMDEMPEPIRRDIFMKED